MNHAIIFDCDGVLVDSEPVSCAAGVATLLEYGVQTDLAEIQTLIGKSYRELLEHYGRRDGQVLDLPGFVGRVEENYFRMAGKLQASPGVAELLEQLSRLRIPIAVASSGGYRKIEFSLEKTGLREFFPVICSAVDVKRGKPEPDLFLYAAERLGTGPGQCIVVEDSLYGVLAAKRAGMTALGYSSSFPAARLRETGADGVISDFAEFFAALEELNLRIAGPPGSDR